MNRTLRRTTIKVATSLAWVVYYTDCNLKFDFRITNKPLFSGPSAKQANKECKLNWPEITSELYNSKPCNRFPDCLSDSTFGKDAVSEPKGKAELRPDTHEQNFAGPVHLRGRASLQGF